MTRILARRLRAREPDDTEAGDTEAGAAVADFAMVSGLLMLVFAPTRSPGKRSREHGS